MQYMEVCALEEYWQWAHGPRLPRPSSQVCTLLTHWVLRRSQEVGITILPTLQMKKPRPGEVRRVRGRDPEPLAHVCVSGSAGEGWGGGFQFSLFTFVSSAFSSQLSV